MPKVFHCSGCGQQHQRPINSKCQQKQNEALNVSSDSVSVGNDQVNMSQTIVNALSAVSSRLEAIERRIDKQEEQIQGKLGSGTATVASPVASSSHTQELEVSDAEDDVIIPTMKFLKSSHNIQQAVNQRLQQLASLNEKGMLKSQRGEGDQIMVKCQVPWPQNFVRAGTSKNRVSYDNLSVFQWVAGFCTITTVEPDKTVKNAVLEYVTELMEDAQEFGWASAKGAHALLLCRMEQGKVNWHMTDQIDRIRRAHAQKVATSTQNLNTKKKVSEMQGVPCKYYQNGKCSQKGDHNSGGQLYKHICSHCHTLGKKFSHPSKDCRTKKSTESKNSIRDARTPQPGEIFFNTMRYRSSVTVQSSRYFQSSVSVEKIISKEKKCI